MAWSLFPPQWEHRIIVRVFLWISFLLLIPCRPWAMDQQETIVLTMGSWRTEDILPMNRFLERFRESHPHIRILFDPTTPQHYDAVLEAQLKAGTAPDLFYLRSFSKSRLLYEQGFLEPLDDLSELKDHFDLAMLRPWMGEDGRPYGVPFIATSHGIYYNKDIFTRLDLKIPVSWEELLATAKKIREAGLIPFANTSGDPWTILELVFLNILPNFIGGQEGRLEYLNGRRCFNDPGMVAAFRALEDLRPHLIAGHHTLGYTDSLQLFAQGSAAMFFGGSWDIPYFKARVTSFAWGVFAPPPPHGTTSSHITFHLDAGVGLNAASKNKPAAKAFLRWLCLSESGQILGNLLPGFFPMHRATAPLSDSHAEEFFGLKQGRGTDVRFVWEKLRDGVPDGYAVMQEAAVAVIQKKHTAREAADGVQKALETWYEPARRCGGS